MMENPIKVDDLGVRLILEIPILISQSLKQNPTNI